LKVRLFTVDSFLSGDAMGLTLADRKSVPVNLDACQRRAIGCQEGGDSFGA